MLCPRFKDTCLGVSAMVQVDAYICILLGKDKAHAPTTIGIRALLFPLL
jgi:hypothetical protein